MTTNSLDGPHCTPDAGLVPFRKLHRWDLSPTEAIALQRDLSPQYLQSRAGRFTSSPRPMSPTSDVRRPGAASTARAVSFSCRTERGFSACRASRRRSAGHFPYVPLCCRSGSTRRSLWPSRGCPRIQTCSCLAWAWPRSPRRFGLAAHVGLIACSSDNRRRQSRLCGIL